MDNQEQNYWRKCSSCKKPISFSTRYYVCSVSTCNGQRTGYVFCSVPCFERHLPGARHKDAAAIESHSPAMQTNVQSSSASSTSSSASSPPRRIIPSATSGSSSRSGGSSTPAAVPPTGEVLVIASRLKEYIHARSEFNTSGSVMDALSQHLRIVCERAIENARADGRKTVMDRDFQFLKNYK